MANKKSTSTNSFLSNVVNIGGHQIDITPLTKKEQEYFRMMLPKSGVLFLRGEPGIGKSAIFHSIANKLGLQYIDLRLSQMDETDLGLFPHVQGIGDRECVRFMPPEWAIMANECPTLIHFEELNRCQRTQRNAALQILNERGIGYRFKFNEGVLMVASGNLGDNDTNGDGTEVEEMDNAVKNRLMPRNHHMSVNEWVDAFAKDNVHPYFVQYLQSYPDNFLKRGNENSFAYATPRSWTNLSNYVTTNFGWESTPEMFRDNLSSVGESYIGTSIRHFLNWLDDLMSLTTDMILKDFDKYQTSIKGLTKERKDELLQNFKKYNINNLSNKQKDNLIKFLQCVSKEQVAGYIREVLDDEQTYNYSSVSGSNLEAMKEMEVFKFLKRPELKEVVDAMKAVNSDDDSEI
jgi:hypothetical protein